METVLAHHQLITSPSLLGEVDRAFGSKLKFPVKRRREIIAFLRSHSIYIKNETAVSGVSCRDETDLKILFLAIQAEADFLVSGDQDLLVISEVRGIPILSPRALWERLRW